jgi:osmotically-inducible protein OsmY
VFTLGVGAGIGAVWSYYWDPDRGRARRARQADQLQATVRQQRGVAERQARYVAGKLKGASYRARMATVGDGDGSASDQVIVERVRSQVLGRPEFSSFTVNMEALDGVVTLRGELPDNHHIQALCDAVCEVPGVTGVQSYPHLPHTPAPNKAEAIRHRL